MGIVNLALLVAGIVLVAVGYLRARDPWGRYQALKEQDRNVARYEAWRGGLRDSSTTGASVAMQVLRTQARNAALIALFGFVLVLAGFALPPSP
jgi:hypothetical protein